MGIRLFRRQIGTEERYSDTWLLLQDLGLQERSDLLCYLHGYCRSQRDKIFVKGLIEGMTSILSTKAIKNHNDWRLKGLTT